jgi:hypothetical protein
VVFAGVLPIEIFTEGCYRFERKMKDDRNIQIVALCKFGPGGDFVSIWPQKGVSEYADDKITDTAVISGEPMLFADDHRINIRTWHKPRHSIRTYRRAAKKKPSAVLSGHGWLFTAEFKSVKTA